MCIATVIQTASNSVGMFIGARYVLLAQIYVMILSSRGFAGILRFLIGFGLTFAAAAAPVLITEVAYPSQRAPATSLYNTLWYAYSCNTFPSPLTSLNLSLPGYFESNSLTLWAGSWEASCEFLVSLLAEAIGRGNGSEKQAQITDGMFLLQRLCGVRFAAPHGRYACQYLSFCQP